ncbi:hypothetical protein [Arthrobacter agilis]|uniref:hypothetical protein n=1 Tax=Arthrobacter agilis TaxID=37921 RepID=UPI00278A4D58|nr:hypothetical protein [Arthrobacter agilis]MDQ0734033.1 hypothetical protein [Arthrobacter agilis]
MRPPRPEMSNATPPPITADREPPPLLRVAGGLWLASVAAGALALVIAFLDRETFLSGIQDTALSVDAGIAPEDAEMAATIAFWGSLGAFAVVLLLVVLFVRPLLRGRGWARWALLAVLLLDAGAVLLVQAFLSTDTAGFQPVPHLAVAQLALGVIALAVTLMPPISRWFRGTHQR